MDQVHVIRHKVLVEGLSIRQTAREVGVSRNTVRQYLTRSEPRRVETTSRPRPVREQIGPRIDALLEEWKDRTSAKQRITGSRLHEQLRKEGYHVGITSVREYLWEKRRQQAEVFVPLVHRPGEEAQVDFFEVQVEIEREIRTAWQFVLRLMYSGKDFVHYYDRCDQLALLDAHVHAFESLGAVPQRCIYDNLSPAVRRILGGDRELTGRFQALVSHYLFEPCFTRVGCGHDKGGVESRGKGLRLRYLTPIPQGRSLAAISESVRAELEHTATTQRDGEGHTVAERFEEERPKLRALPAHAFDPRSMESVSVSSQALVKVDRATYSVPSRWARLEITALVGVEEITFVWGEERVTCPRQPRGGRHIRYRHYLEELAKKPQALRQVAPEVVAELGEPYGRLWSLLVETHGAREAARTLARVVGATLEHGEEAVRAALEAALQAQRADLLALAPTLGEREEQRVVQVPETLSGYVVESGAAADYDHLLAGEGGAL